MNPLGWYKRYYSYISIVKYPVLGLDSVPGIHLKLLIKDVLYVMNAMSLWR